ncbi:stromelysin-2-like [Amphiura filiformis]|uniref:stromelysin-2-like n=1 Tax=Amphiura filiformis TaxID=82378 RepID=UPI003B224885
MRFKCIQVALFVFMASEWLTDAKPAYIADSAIEAHQDDESVKHVARRSVTNKQEAMSYLKKYNHMSESGGDSDLYDALTSFQIMTNITVTGEMNSETMAMMSKDRCGVKDNMGMSNKMRRRRYDAMNRWPEDEITWRVSSVTDNLSRRDIVDTLERALSLWAEHSGLTFTQITDLDAPVDFNIEFKAGDHGDGPNQGLIFDGRGNVLAHTFFPSGNPEPSLAGDIHFDRAEYFTLNSRHGTNFFQLALHELGHSLGLGHSDNMDAVMAPFSKEYTPNYSLHPDDIAGIRYLYGQGGRKPDYTMAPNPGNPRCPDGLDAMVGTKDGWVFAFRGRWVWSLDKKGILGGWPMPIADIFSGLPDNIDAALFFKEQFHFFKGRHVFIFTIKFAFIGRFPIDKYWKGVPDDIDAAFHWSGNGKIYFIKGTEYWRFNTHWKKVDWGYPLPLHKWDLGFDQVDTVLQWEDSPTYFFTGNDYYRYDDKRTNPKRLSTSHGSVLVWLWLFEPGTRWKFCFECPAECNSCDPHSYPYHHAIVLMSARVPVWQCASVTVSFLRILP